MNATDNRRHELGRVAEDEAVALLRRKGMRIVARNWRGGGQELDVIARDGDTLVFVEVRARKAGGKVSAAESVTPAKRRSVRKGAQLYLAETGQWDMPCRFDVVAAADMGPDPLSGKPFSLRLEHFSDVM